MDTTPSTEQALETDALISDAPTIAPTTVAPTTDDLNTVVEQPQQDASNQPESASQPAEKAVGTELESE